MKNCTSGIVENSLHIYRFENRTSYQLNGHLRLQVVPIFPQG